MEVQPSLVLLQKTLLNIEGLGKQLYPDLDLWDNALPFLEQWQKERLSPIANLRKLSEKIPEWIEALPELPELVYETLKELKTARKHRETMALEFSLKRSHSREKRAKLNKRLGVTALIAALIILHPDVAAQLSQLPIISVILATIGLALLILSK